MGDEKDAFYVVRKGGFYGVYKSISDLQSVLRTSVDDTPLSVYKGYGLSKKAEDFLSSHGLKNAIYCMDAGAIEGDLFGQLLTCPFREPNSSKDKSVSKNHVEKRPQQRYCMDAIDDIFESSLNLEESHLKEGYDEGYAEGIVSGKEEGRDVGLKTGFETGEKPGFYRGCVDIWSSAVRADPGFMSARIQRTIKQMDELLRNYPMLELENEAVSDSVDALRLKFRAICASLNLKLEYKGYPRASGAESIDF